MPKIEKAERRDRKRAKVRRGMQVDGRTTKTVLPNLILRRAEKLAQKREREGRNDNVDE